MAVADGAGSSQYSDIGSQQAATVAVEIVACELPALLPELQADGVGSLLRHAFEAAERAVQAAADGKGVSSRELATTLIIAIATPDLIRVAQIGDGAVVALIGDGDLVALTRPPRGEYANETSFITSSGWESELQWAAFDGIVRGLAAFSDGLQLLALDMRTGEPFPPFFGPLFSYASSAVDTQRASEELTTFLRSPRVSSVVDDDITVVVGSFHADAPPFTTHAGT